MALPLNLESRTLNISDLTVPVRDYRPEGASRELLPVLWVHGGGFVGGDLDMKESDLVARILAERTGRWVRAADYRKVPIEPLGGRVPPKPTPNQFPAAREDVNAAMDDLVGLAGGCIIGGASAGACLVEAVRLHRRDNHQLQAAGSFLAYGTFHATLPTLTPEDPRMATGSGHQFTPEFVRTMNLNYAGTEATLEAPETFPGLQSETGLAPTLMIDAERDRLRASGDAYALELQAAGVPLSRSIEKGSQHGFLNDEQAVGFASALDKMVSWLAAMP